MRATRIGDVSERFFERFEVDSKTGCWNWTGRLNGSGYGVIAGPINGKRYVEKGVNMLAHRASWILHKGEIPKGAGAHGTVVMHRCDNPACVNPDHLLLGTQSDNVKDMLDKGRKVSNPRRGTDHPNTAFKSQADIDLICSTKGRIKEFAEKYGVSESAIKRLRQRNGVGTNDPERFHTKNLPQEAIDHIRSTPPGTRGLTKQYGLSKTAIARIRKGLTYR